MKRFLFTIFVTMLIMLPSFVSAEERAPIRVARIPIIVQDGYVPDNDTLEALETKLDRALHIPLNDTLHAVEYLPEKECEAALAGILTEMNRTSRKVKLKDAMKPLAEKLQADIVICPVLEHYYQYSYASWNWNHGTILHSSAAIELTGYERATDQVFRKSFSKSYHDDYSSWGAASTLAKECMDHVIQETGIHSMITKWYSNTGNPEQTLSKEAITL